MAGARNCEVKRTAVPLTGQCNVGKYLCKIKCKLENQMKMVTRRYGKEENELL